MNSCSLPVGKGPPFCRRTGKRVGAQQRRKQCSPKETRLLHLILLWAPKKRWECLPEAVKEKQKMPDELRVLEGSMSRTELRVIHSSWYHPHTCWTFSWWRWEQAESQSCRGATQLVQMFGHWSSQLLPPPCSPGTGAPCACTSPSSTALLNTGFTSTEGPWRDSDPLHYQLQDLLFSPKVTAQKLG